MKMAPVTLLMRRARGLALAAGLLTVAMAAQAFSFESATSSDPARRTRSDQRAMLRARARDELALERRCHVAGSARLHLGFGRRLEREGLRAMATVQQPAASARPERAAVKASRAPFFMSRATVVRERQEERGARLVGGEPDAVRAACGGDDGAVADVPWSAAVRGTRR